MAAGDTMQVSAQHNMSEDTYEMLREWHPVAARRQREIQNSRKIMAIYCWEITG
jgi:hypothetical protein